MDCPGLVERRYNTHTPLERLGICFPIQTDIIQKKLSQTILQLVLEYSRAGKQNENWMEQSTNQCKSTNRYLTMTIPKSIQHYEEKLTEIVASSCSPHIQ